MSVYLKKFEEQIEKTHNLNELETALKEFKEEKIIDCFDNTNKEKIKKITQTLNKELELLSNFDKKQEEYITKELEKFIKEQIPNDFRKKFLMITGYTKQYNQYKARLESMAPNNVFYKTKDETIRIINKTIKEIITIEKIK
ncbi:MAG TPA: hypothetical protein VI790_02580 [Candidatus Nanoarchaeia archaeon]|nr:hypothetical protein [Candidatus Nanoarchaeia archaeon]